jgi:3-oxoacyl-[acyl-carrier-protein] synthase II
MLNAVSALVSVKHRFMGPSFNVASACATANHSIAVSALLILSGEADVMIAGGGAAATRLNTVAGFGNARALGCVASIRQPGGQPFYESVVMGEGAGGASSSRLRNILKTRGNASRLSGRMGCRAMPSTRRDPIRRPRPEAPLEAALRRAGIEPADVGYINPHATSTPQGDVAEYLSMKQVFGAALPRIPLSATKSMIGHLLGGAGAAEAIAVVCSLKDQVVHPSINVDRLDPVFEINLVREARRCDFRYAISNSAGFGHNCVLTSERAGARSTTMTSTKTEEIPVTRPSGASSSSMARTARCSSATSSGEKDLEASDSRTTRTIFRATTTFFT